MRKDKEKPATANRDMSTAGEEGHGAVPLAEAPGDGVRRIGATLRQTREEKGLSIEDVARLTHIRIHHLQSLEAGDIARLPGTTFALGFLRIYSRFLGFPEQEMAARFNEALKLGNAALTTQVFPPPASTSRSRPTRWMVLGGVLTIVALLVAYEQWQGAPGLAIPDWVGTVTDYFTRENPEEDLPRENPPPADGASGLPSSELQEEDPAPQELASAPAGLPESASSAVRDTIFLPSDPEEPPQARPESAPAQPKPQPDQAAPWTPLASSPALASATGSGEPQRNTSFPAPRKREREPQPAPERPAGPEASPPAAPASPAQSASSPPAEPAVESLEAAVVTGAGTESTGRVIVDVKERVWLRIQDSQGGRMRAGTLDPGERLVIPGDGAGYIGRFGNAGGILLWVDGRPMPALGPRGMIARDVDLSAAGLLRRFGMTGGGNPPESANTPETGNTTPGGGDQSEGD
ncbi:MAG: helix-turn-helix domain-containing protein [Magnetococcales bacterium]|nr:helix-turn-helix domain-containing protein [Magnetococcales bacterium]